MFSQADLAGAYTALVTPFSHDAAAVDLEALDALVEAQIAGGVSGLIPCGTSGESPTLTKDEQKLVIRRTVRIAQGRVPVVAGTGSFSTEETIATSLAAFEAGADAAMVVMPYYSRPTQAGLVEHVCRVALAVKGPIVLYNIPARTGVDLGADATEAICRRAPNVVGLKDATGNVLRCQELVRRLGERLSILSGDDALTLPMMASGARGVISVVSNLLPGPVSELCRLALAYEYQKAQRVHFALLPVSEAMFLEANPAPIKWALAQKGMIKNVVRSPLVVATEGVGHKIIDAVQRFEAGS
ncbi:MAG TPA: 4-hydroxy-tetrahydrodipicolinate synthase [Polyangiaceae bacterium]|nr:4-hydroxy-tetrahydrodipicolinate synthase [Polyangiaceae bacterium]